MKIGVTSLLGILFIALKLTKQIDWSWVWVLSPFWIPLAILTVVLVVCLIGSIFEKDEE